MKLRKYLLVPRLLLLAAGAPRDQRLAWDPYWSEVVRTGFDGDVLWDAGEQTELTESVKRLYRPTTDRPSWATSKRCCVSVVRRTSANQPAR